MMEEFQSEGNKKKNSVHIDHAFFFASHKRKKQQEKDRLGNPCQLTRIYTQGTVLIGLSSRDGTGEDRLRS